MEMRNTTAVSPGMIITNDYDCINASYMVFDNLTNETTCLRNESTKTAWDIVGIFIVSIILGLMTLITIVGKYYVSSNQARCKPDYTDFLMV